MSINMNQIPANNIPAKFVTTTGEKAWHNVHENIGEDAKFDLKLALERAGENYDVIKTNLINPFSGEKLENTFGIFRDDPNNSNKVFFGACKSRYEPSNNYDTLAPLFDMMKDLNIGIDSMAFWPTGHVAANFKIMETFPVKGDQHKHFLQAYFGHDGITSIKYFDSVIRMVCSNTVTHALNSAQSMLNVKHTKGAKFRLTEYAMLMSNMQGEIKTFQERLAFLATKRLTVNQVENVLNNMFGEAKVLKTGEIKNNTREAVLRLFEKNDDNAFPEIKGTAYNLFNAITEYNTHEDKVTIQGNYDKSEREAIETSRRIKGNITSEFNGTSKVPKFFEIVMPMVN